MGEEGQFLGQKVEQPQCSVRFQSVRFSQMKKNTILIFLQEFFETGDPQQGRCEQGEERPDLNPIFYGFLSVFHQIKFLISFPVFASSMISLYLSSIFLIKTDFSLSFRYFLHQAYFLIVFPFFSPCLISRRFPPSSLIYRVFLQFLIKYNFSFLFLGFLLFFSSSLILHCFSFFFLVKSKFPRFPSLYFGSLSKLFHYMM
jgi:hypothetical protein